MAPNLHCLTLFLTLRPSDPRQARRAHVAACWPLIRPEQAPISTCCPRAPVARDAYFNAVQTAPGLFPDHRTTVRTASSGVLDGPAQRESSLRPRAYMYLTLALAVLGRGKAGDLLLRRLVTDIRGAAPEAEKKRQREQQGTAPRALEHIYAPSILPLACSKKQSNHLTRYSAREKDPARPSSRSASTCFAL